MNVFRFSPSFFFSLRLTLASLVLLSFSWQPSQAAIITVTSTNCSGGFGNLRSAISQAQDGDEIHFDLSGAINCGLGSTNWRYLIQDKDITIVGPVTIDGGDSTATLFWIRRDARVTFRDITFQNSRGRFLPYQAGAVYIDGGDAEAIFYDCNFNYCQAYQNGGAVYNTGIGRFYGCSFSGNLATGYGGAIYNDSYLRMNNCYFGTLAPNRSQLHGGAIYNSVSGNMALTGCAFLGNQTLEGMGGGVYHAGTTSLQLYQCTFSDNLAPAIGGGLACAENLVMAGSTFDHNRAGKMGGGLAVLETGHATVLTSTFSANQTDSTGGGIVNFGVVLMESGTITLNEAAVKGGGLHNAGAGYLEINNTLIAQNLSQGSNSDVSSTVPADFLSLGYNLIGDIASANLSSQSSDLIGNALQPIDPKLAPLGTYGGTINVHPLREDSPARCFGDPALDSTYDQREFLRIAPLGIGAYESEIKCVGGGIPEGFVHAFSLAPNPVQAGQQLQLVYQVPISGSFSIVLMDVQGRNLLRSSPGTIHPEGELSLLLPTSLVPGIYLVQCFLDEELVGMKKLQIL